MSLEQTLLNHHVSSFINNEFSKSQKKQSFISPVTKEVISSIEVATPDQINLTIEAAQKAFIEWKFKTAYARSQVLEQIVSLMKQNKDMLAKIMTLEMGKPITEALAEVEYAIGYFSWYAGEAIRIFGTIIPSKHLNKRISIIYEPVGPCALITPWNFPLAIPARKIAAALAAGCSVIIKPAPECPLSTLAIAMLAKEAGLPPGCLNVLLGSEQEIGKSLLDSPIIKKVSFTGSCEVGELLYKQSASTLKKLTLELGGHAPVIVFNDADPVFAAQQVVAAKLRNNGQTCVAPNRIFVQQEIYKKFTGALIDIIQKLVIGNPLDPKTNVSSILHPSAQEKVPEHLQDALSKGAKVLFQGKEIFVPTVLENVNDTMILFHEETFGPLFPLIQFNNDDEAIVQANNSQFGLASYVFSSNIGRAHKAAELLQYGIVSINDGLPSSAEMSFGGIKGSGFGREGGPTGIKEYLTEKCISLAFLTCANF